MELTLPDLGENIDEAEVLSVLVKKGDTVSKDQPLLELETDKATFELPSPGAGTVSAIHVKKGDMVRVGQKVLTLEAGAPGERRVTHPQDGPPAEKEKKRPTAAEQERAEAEQERAEAEQERAEADEERAEEGREAPAAPRIRQRETAAADQREDPTALPEDGAANAARARHSRPRPRADEGADEAEDEAAPRAPGGTLVAAGPAARRMAREHGVDLGRLQGTGAGGRITPEDVKAFVRDHAAAGREPATTAPDVERWGPVERRPLTGIERAAARHLAAAWDQIPHVTHHDLADVTELEESRRRYESGRTESDPKLTWTVLVVKAVAAALAAFPRFNSSLDAARAELVLKGYVHVGVAVDTEHGLLVPVIRDANRKTTREIADELADLAERARARKLAREEMQGASFTVTNLGGIGGVAFTPIVNLPEVAILGVSRGRDELALRDGKVVRRVVLPLSLSYDHRVINGADAARFVRYLAQLLEDPVRLLLES